MATFTDKVYTAVRDIPPGRVTTYAAIGRAIGSNGYRAIGNALSRNPSYLKTPCHRVVGSDGSVKNWAWGVQGKIKMLGKEGVQVKDGKVVNLRELFWKPPGP